MSRTCQASGSGEPFWDGNEAICKSECTLNIYIVGILARAYIAGKFRDPAEIAASLRANFLDRVIACKDAISGNGGRPTSFPSTEATPLALPTPKSDSKSLCKGRSIIVGDGCVDIAFAVDCSKSMKGKLFGKSIEFVKTIVSVFSHVDNGDARFALLTYDDKAKIHFTFDSLTGSDVREAINSPNLNKSCWGATGTSDVLRKLHQNIFAVDATKLERRECTKAAFLITDGYTNWGGSPERFAQQIRESNVTMYAFAIRDLKSEDPNADRGIKSLKNLVKQESRVMEVVDILDVVKKAFSVTVGKHLFFSE